jgi:hypothetical protein
VGTSGDATDLEREITRLLDNYDRRYDVPQRVTRAILRLVERAARRAPSDAGAERLNTAPHDAGHAAARDGVGREAGTGAAGARHAT